MPHPDKTRRWFVGSLTAALMALLGLILATPAVAYVLSPLWKKRDEASAGSGLLDAGPVADLPAGRWLLVPVEVVRRDGWETTRTNRSVWVRRAGDGNVTVLSPTCPHLGCSILWQSESSQFMCPCHKGVFDAEGNLTGGPPPRGMDPLESDVKDGRLLIRWQDFKIGSPERKAVEA